MSIAGEFLQRFGAETVQHLLSPPPMTKSAIRLDHDMIPRFPRIHRTGFSEGTGR